MMMSQQNCLQPPTWSQSPTYQPPTSSQAPTWNQPPNWNQAPTSSQPPTYQPPTSSQAPTWNQPPNWNQAPIWSQPPAYQPTWSQPPLCQPTYQPPTYQPPVQQNLSTQAQQFVSAHNNYRNNTDPRATNMQPIQWANDLATSASNWAAQCKWEHSRTPNVGENLYASSIRTSNTNTYNPTDAVNSWGNEKLNYNYDTNSCAPGEVCGHYTQVVWADSNKVGCAVQDCPSISGIPWSNGGTMVVCQYSPPGNWIGQKPYQST
ncbi:putative peptidase inhibitor 15-like isoform X2 [Tupanvirus deep ocean]|uniref:Peptidase inhibitor 15-like isoform X2 n=2 Tax=Tupanvirus TaxID=2094720 RepID=A0AC62A8G4_9VIRU|nr:putative peptidase inhibitor 15-like isoform X2 [Tupanvirus deep ocean]QKU34037.1 putative peptidase inhibitor 15-like isoform X2 [Tupanvirus deep ocean]